MNLPVASEAWVAQVQAEVELHKTTASRYMAWQKVYSEVQCTPVGVRSG